MIEFIFEILEKNKAFLKYIICNKLNNLLITYIDNSNKLKDQNVLKNNGLFNQVEITGLKLQSLFFF